MTPRPTAIVARPAASCARPVPRDQLPAENLARRRLGDLVDAPDNTTAMALPMLLGSSKAFSKVQTTVLMETGEAQQAMRKAADARYRPPA